jgi:hypothetical protein
MDKRYSQLELFSEGREAEPVREQAERTPFIFQINRYEKTIFMLIGFIVTGISFYCLGVEHGKARSLARMNSEMDLAAKPAAAPVKRCEAPPVAVIPAASPILVQAAVVPQQAKAEKKGSFTIQVGTYQAKTAAERERDKLAKSGFVPLIVKQGVYNVVLVGNFTKKETAISSLSRLRQNYRDCYIRRL